MRTNLPVTASEVRLLDGRTIVSTTDLKGRITYANPYFVEVSGFALSELIGAPQNIVRHPDMPPEAFADMWTAIKGGQPWTGMVKNRCKNGDYYWVKANVTPVVESGKPVGYMSVRTKPSREEVAEADALYARMRKGDAPLVLRRGRLVRRGLPGRLDALRRMGLCAQTALLCAAVAAGALLLAATGDTAWSSAVAVGIAVLAGLLWCSVRFQILAPLERATALSMKLAGGDMTARRLHVSDDEVGRLLAGLQQVGTNLQSVIGDVRSNFAHMQRATGEVAQGNMDLSGRTESQASSLEETAASMEQLARSIEDNSHHVAQADQLADQAVAAAHQGSAAVKTMLASMDAAAGTSRQVLEITGMIEAIAFQTNILALNAAVEAARAGEQGRGFAVVASEVRTLAARCSASAKEVAQLVNSSIGAVDASVQSSRAVSERVNEVVASIGTVKEVLGEVADAAREQARGVAQVNAAVNQLDSLTQQNAALVEQTAAATASVVDQTDGIADALAVFKLAKGDGHPQAVAGAGA